MYYIRNTKCIMVKGGLDMLDGMDRWEIKYELFSSVCTVVSERLFTAAFINSNTTHTDIIPICT
jgi:hypothetical protein